MFDIVLSVANNILLVKRRLATTKITPILGAILVNSGLWILSFEISLVIHPAHAPRRHTTAHTGATLVFLRFIGHRHFGGEENGVFDHFCRAFF